MRADGEGRSPVAADRIAIAPLRREDAEALVAAEDAETVRWLTGGWGTVDGTRAYVDRLAADAARGSTKRAFSIAVDGSVVGSVDFDADPQDGIGPGDVNISYTISPSWRGRGVTARAVRMLCEEIKERGVGTRAVIRCDPANAASARVAQKAGFRLQREILSSSETDENGRPVRLCVYAREL